MISNKHGVKILRNLKLQSLQHGQKDKHFPTFGD